MPRVTIPSVYYEDTKTRRYNLRSQVAKSTVVVRYLVW